MTMQVIYADEVLDGELRMYAVDAKDADTLRGVIRLRELHRVKLTGYPLAIVDRPAPEAAPAGGATIDDAIRSVKHLTATYKALGYSPDYMAALDRVTTSLSALKENGGPLLATCDSAASAQPPPVLDLDALAEAERVMTANLAVEAGSVPLGDTGDYDAYIHIVDRDGRVVVIMNSPEADRSLALARGIVALRNAAAHLIAEASAAVVLRQELAEVAHMLAVATSRYDACVTKLAEARRLGLEACAHARALARGAPDVSTRDESVDAIVDALEAL